MTNSARYATGSVVEVTVTWGPARLCVRVRDHGLPAGREPSGVKGGGTGISSMAGRIEAAGGRLTAGPLADRGPTRWPTGPGPAVPGGWSSCPFR